MEKEVTNAAGATVLNGQEQNSSTESKCPVAHGARKEFNYAEEFKKLYL